MGSQTPTTDQCVCRVRFAGAEIELAAPIRVLSRLKAYLCSYATFEPDAKVETSIRIDVVADAARVRAAISQFGTMPTSEPQLHGGLIRLRLPPELRANAFETQATTSSTASHRAGRSGSSDSCAIRSRWADRNHAAINAARRAYDEAL